MPNLDRNRLVELLVQLGGVQDDAVLTAAREANRMVTEAGQSWDRLLLNDVADVSANTIADEPTLNVPAEKGGDLRIIERLLARKDISDTLRGDLQDFKRSIADGAFDRGDSEYLRALAKRLGA